MVLLHCCCAHCNGVVCWASTSNTRGCAQPSTSASKAVGAAQVLLAYALRKPLQASLLARESRSACAGSGRDDGWSLWQRVRRLLHVRG